MVSTADATLTFIDDEVANPDQELTAGVWMIDTYIDGRGDGYNISASPSVQFLDDGTLSVNTGCVMRVGLLCLW